MKWISSCARQGRESNVDQDTDHAFSQLVLTSRQGLLFILPVPFCPALHVSISLDSHALIGRELEPVGALPVIVEDEVLVGGNCGVYEGRWSRSERCSAREPFSIARRRCTIWCGRPSTGPAMTSPW